jgi:hypothetical protein
VPQCIHSPDTLSAPGTATGEILYISVRGVVIQIGTGEKQNDGSISVPEAMESE